MITESKDPWQQRLLKLEAAYQLKAKEIYETAIIDIAKTASKFTFKGFYINKYPLLKKRIDLTLRSIANALTLNVVNGITQAWTLSDKKNTVFLDKNLAGFELSDTARAIYYDTNAAARKAFINRQVKGLKLSDRVWQHVQGFRPDMEADMLAGISTGRPAKAIAKEMRVHLLNPVENNNPGQGVYKSPLKNAYRLTRTEINMSYQNADFERWNSQPFVVGIKVSLSNAHPESDECDQLKGNYPKDFVFVGWHPQCLCHATPILITREEMDRYQDSLFDNTDWDGHSVNSVTAPPDNFHAYLEKNKERINGLSTPPYWVKDNADYTVILKEK